MLKDKLAEKIREKSNDFRYTTLSQKTGIKEETILLILKGITKNPGVYTVAKLADALECSIDELIDRQGFLEKFLQTSTKDLKYNHKIFNEVLRYVTNYTENSKGLVYNFSDVIYAVNDIYEHSINNNLDNIDKAFAEWFCKNQMCIK